ncbi:MAG: CoA transferase [Chloroflexi bacterium]|nr:CoA transferase [Chloroflexota bacterium]
MSEGAVLTGIRVLDMSQSVAGPYCGVLLGYLGAEVIKVEPSNGEVLRHLGSQWEINWNVILANQNKKGITLNLGTERAKDIFSRLVAKVDVLIESFVPPAMEAKWGLTHEYLAACNPGLIHASVTGFGKDNAYSQVPAYDMSLQAMGGWMAATGPEDGPPVVCAAASIDFATGSLLFGLILAALRQRDQTGKGQLIEVCMREVAINSNLVPNRLFFETGASVRRFGNRSWGMTPGNVYRASDGWVYLRAMTDEQADAILTLVGRPELCRDERFSTRGARWRNRAEVDRIVNAWTEQRTKKEIFDLFTSHDMQCAIIMEPGEVLQDPVVVGRGAVVEIDQPAVGKVKLTTPNFSMSDSPRVAPGPAPLVGEHNYSVYEDLLGFGEEEIDRLKQQGVI